MKKRFVFNIVLLFVFLFFNIFLVSSSLEVSKLEASGISNGDRFGSSVSISGDYAIVGSPLDDDKGTNSGSAYIFKKNSTRQFNFFQHVVPAVIKKGSWFGSSVSISGDYAIVGSTQNEVDYGTGLAYIFKKDNSNNFNLIKTINERHDNMNMLGWSVFSSGNYFLVGEFWDLYWGGYPYVYIFEKDSSDNFAKIFTGKGGEYVSPTNYFYFNPTFSAFENYFAFSGVIGNHPNNYYNVVRVYKKDSNGKIILLDTVVPEEGDAQFLSDYSLGLSQEYLVSGYFDENVKKSAVKIYKKVTGEKFLFHQTILIGGEIDLNGLSANSIAISEKYLAVGNYYEENGKGVVYVYKKNSSGVFEFFEKLIPTERKINEYFGISVSIYEDDLIIGASGSETSKGSAYIVNLNPTQICSQSLLNTSKTSWVNISNCLSNNQQTQSCNWTEYDANNCGTFPNVTHFEYQTVSCVFCTQFLKNTTIPSEWNNISEVNGQMNQSRNWTEYDANNCGTFPNVTHFEYRLIPLNIVLSSPSCESFGGYCSPVSLENASLDENFLCTSTLDDCYFCNEGFSFNDRFECVNSNQLEWSCESGLGYSYWEDDEGEKKWIYSSVNEDLNYQEECSEYGDSFCCPEGFSCNDNGKCVFEEPFFEFCSFLKNENSCINAPIFYAKNEISSIRGDSFSENTCSSIWYEDASNNNCELKSSCDCFWNSSLGKCFSIEKLENSCDGANSPNPGFCIYDSVSESDECDSTGYYIREIVATIFGNSKNIQNCANSTQKIPCLLNSLSLPFFGIFGFIFAIIILLFVYLFFYSKKFKKLFT